jgi:hypothetical protein
MYSIVLRAHLNTGHGGREKMLKEVNKKYANVTRDVLNLFKEMCEETTNFRPILHFLLLFSHISISFISALPLSTLPYD